MAKWGDIQNLVQSNLGRVGDPNVLSLLPTWADLFQKEAQADRNWWFLKTVASRVLTGGVQSYALPSNYKDGLVFYILQLVSNGDPADAMIELDPITDLDVIRSYAPPGAAVSTRGQPEAYIIGDETVTFWPCPDKPYTIRSQYWKDIDPPLASSLSAFTNAWIDKYPTLYEAGLTEMGFRSLQQMDDAQVWEGRKEKVLAKLRASWVARELAGFGKLAFVPKRSVYDTTRNSQNDIWKIYE